MLMLPDWDVFILDQTPFFHVHVISHVEGIYMLAHGKKGESEDAKVY